jgi:hypothetical protein
MCWQLFDTFGILTGSVVNYIIYCYSQDDPNWRIMISISGAPALMFLTLILFCVGRFIRPFELSPYSLTQYVESPRWLMKKNRYKEALNSFIVLHQLPSPIIACGQLYMIYRQLEAEEKGYLLELKEKQASKKGKGRAADGDLELQTQEQRYNSACEEQNGVLHQSYMPLQNRDPIETQTTSSASTLRTRHHAIAESSNEASDQQRERDQVSRPDKKTRQESAAPPLGLANTSLRKRIMLLWHVGHIRRSASLFANLLNVTDNSIQCIAS